MCWQQGDKKGTWHSLSPVLTEFTDFNLNTRLKVLLRGISCRSNLNLNSQLSSPASLMNNRSGDRERGERYVRALNVYSSGLALAIDRLINVW